MEKRGYYVVSHLAQKRFLPGLKMCLESIRRVDKTNRIILIDNQSPIKFSESDFPEINNLEIWRNDTYPRAGFTVPYWYNHQFKRFSQYMVIHDTMIMKKTIPDEIWEKDFTFSWYADHCVRNKTNGEPYIKKFCDQISRGQEVWETYLTKSQDCVPWCTCKDCREKIPLNGNKDLSKYWTVCFGCSLVVKEELISKLFEEFELEKIFPIVVNKRAMEACERLWAVLIYLQTGETGAKNYLNGDINRHSHCGYNMIQKVDNLDDYFKFYEKYDAYCLKNWGYRQ